MDNQKKKLENMKINRILYFVFGSIFILLGFRFWLLFLIGIFLIWIAWKTHESYIKNIYQIESDNIDQSQNDLAVSEEPIIKPIYYHLNFNVAGVTFKTGRKSRQVMLKKIKFHDEPFQAITSVEFSPYEYNGDNAYGVIVNGEQIGSIPQNKISDFESHLKYPLTVTALDIVGGGSYSYGCEITIKFDIDDNI